MTRRERRRPGSIACVSDGAVIAEYRASGVYRWMLLVALLVCVGILAMIWFGASTTGAALFGCLLAAVPIGWLVYGFGFRIADRLELTPTELAWRSPLWKGRVRLDGIRSMTDALPVVDAVRITVADGRPIYVRVGGGLSQFESRTVRAAPHIRLTVSRRQESAEARGADGYSERA